MAMSANAQVFQYGFEESDPASVIQPTNWENFATSDYNPAYTEDVISGERSLHAVTEGTSQSYERVVGLFGNVIKEKTAYRLTFKAKGKGSMNVGILKGTYNHDLALQGGKGDSFTDQVFDVIMPTSTRTFTYMVWCPSKEDMTRKRQTQSWVEDKNDLMTDEYWNQDFVRFSFNTEGDFLVDDVTITETTVQSVSFNESAVCVNFGFATNIKDLAGSIGAQFDADCFTVTADEEEIDITSVELHNDGLLYIFLDDELEEDAEVKVSFKNNGTLKYTSNIAPNCFEDPNGAVVDFEEVAVFDDDLEAESMEYDEAVLESTFPLNNSFEMDVNTQEFKFNFSKTVLANSTKFGAPEATLDGPGISNESLVLVSTEEGSTLVFKRSGSTPMSKGSYTLTIENVCNKLNRRSSAASLPATTFEAGEIKVGKSEFTMVADGTFPEALENNVPEGWTIVTDSEVRLPNEEGYTNGGGRVFAFTGSTVAKACYFRTSNATQVGSLTSPVFTLPAGDIEFRPIIAAWKNSVNFKLEILKNDADSTVFYTTNVASKVNLNGGKEGKEFQVEKIRFKAEAGEYIFRASINEPGDAMIEAVCGGFKAYTYIEEDGDKPENTYYMSEDFSHSSEQVMVANSGWVMYDTNTGFDTKPWCKPGEGRSACGGVLNRNNMRGLYIRCASPATQYALFGSDVPEALAGLTRDTALVLPAGTLTLTYETTGWNGDVPNTWFEIFPYVEGEMYGAADQAGYIVRNQVKCQSYLSDGHTPDPLDKVMMDFKVPSEGRYVIKLTTDGGGNGAMFFNINIMKMGLKGVQYKIDLFDLIAKAEEELNTAKADANNVGATQDALEAIINKYKTTTLHTVAEYTAATSEINAAIKAMQARRANVADYVQGSMAELKQLIEDAKGTKFEALDLYAAGVQTVARYDGKLCTDLSDEELAAAVADINLGYKRLDYMIKTGVGLLTKQMTDLCSMLVEADPDQAEAEIVLAVGNELTDNQNIVKWLKQLNVAYLYKKLATFEFVTFNEDTQENDSIELDLTPFIQNADFYTMTTVRENVSLDAWPGWTLELGSNEMVKTGYDAGWDKSDVSEEKSVVCAPVKQGYVGNGNLKTYQTLTYLPVGKYAFSFKTLDSSFRGNDGTDPMDSYIYYTVSEENADTIPFSNETIGQYYDFSVCRLGGMEVPASNGVFGEATIGGHQMAHNSFSGLWNAKLYLTDKLEGYDYAKASEELFNELATGLEAREDAPVAVSYYNLNGQQTVATQGINIKVERYSDGYTVVKKVIVK